jgi:hypothetical protein
MNRAIDVYDPTPSTSVGVYGASTSVPRFGARIFVANSQGINAFSPGFQIGPYANSIATADAHITVAMLTAY